MTECPYCELGGSRGQVHAHMADAHPEEVSTWTEAGDGRMRYRVVCPRCGAEHEARVKPRSQDPDFLEGFAREIRLVACDMLLCHMEAEHDGEPAAQEPPSREESVPPAGSAPPPRARRPAASAAGGRGRPGAEGVPLPPGMAEPELPAWMAAVEEMKRGKVKPSGSDR
jgi:hypothetical protein